MVVPRFYFRVMRRLNRMAGTGYMNAQIRCQVFNISVSAVTERGG